MTNAMNGTVKPMEVEMEALRTDGDNGPTVRAATPQHVHYLEQLWTLTKLYMEYYPKITTVIVFCLIGLVMSMVIPELRKPVTRNRLHHDYTTIASHYDFKASQIDHWCLWGGDEKCKCLDFTMSESRVNTKGWLQVHEENKKRVKDSAGLRIDITFVGDGMVEMLNGSKMGLPQQEGGQISNIFKKYFTKDGGGEFEGLALGIAGDESANVIWRLEHGELSNSNIYWLWNGVTDLTDGYCSEEATVLGILKTAELIAFHDPEAVVVVQGILPVSRHDGRLDFYDSRFGVRPNNKKAHSVSQAKKRYLFWPSIVAINKELEEFCAKHEQIVYFDASDLFLGTMGNKHYHQPHKQILSDLMPDFKNLSPAGYEVLLHHISGEMENLLFENDEANDIEKKDKEGGRAAKLRHKE